MKCDKCKVKECETRDIVLKKYPDSTLYKILAIHFMTNCSKFIGGDKNER